jgi:hypothetical protein
MKAVNKAWAKGEAACKAIGMTDTEIAAIKKDMPSYEKKPYPTWALSNNSAEIRRVKSKIEELAKLDQAGEEEVSFIGGKMVVNLDANRVQFVFDGKPSEAVREILKGHGYRWAPSEGAWQRQRTAAAVAGAKRLILQIEEARV